MKASESNESDPRTELHWSVLRMDDAGNTFVVREHLSRGEAERIAAEFTARGHKQIYWVKMEE